MGLREFYEVISSTQDRAIALARAGAPEGSRVVARRQRSGRGRVDHRWASPAGGLYLSVILSAPSEHGGLLPLALGARLGDEIGRRYRLSLRLKWPNDLLFIDRLGAARKLSGILVEEVPSPALGRAAVAGIGVNVTTQLADVPPELREELTSLSQLLEPPPSLPEVEEVVVETALKAAQALRDREGVEATRRLCRSLLFGVGRRVSVDGRPSGRIEGLGDEGELWLDTGTGRVAIRAGDLRIEDER